MSTSYPFWVTSEDLGTYPEEYSFTLNPVLLYLGESDNQPCTVSLLNGSLPPGVSWRQTGYQVTLVGQAANVDQDTLYEFTLRANNGVFVSDRTFKVQITNVVVQQFVWKTSNQYPLLKWYKPQPVTVEILAEATPFRPLTYSITNIGSISQGISMDSLSGRLTVDLRWKSAFLYKANTDLIITETGLYECVVGGYSGGNSAPRQLGFEIVDTDYPSWYPNRYYSLNDVVYADQGKIYVCVFAGYSDNNAPIGRVDRVVSGTSEWKYIKQAPIWNQVSVNTEIITTLNITASTGTQTLSRNFDIWFLSTPYKPLWITPPGTLPDAQTETNWVYQLSAQDPENVQTGFSSVNLPSWLKITPEGLLYGTAPFVVNNTTYSFDVTVTDGVTSVSQGFTVTVTEDVIEFQWVTAQDLGVLGDGTYSDKGVLATTIRSSVIHYGLRGGMIPLGLRLNPTTGSLEGYVEYHGIVKTYQFLIQATDGTDVIQRLFVITVQPQNIGIHWNLSFPLLGQDKNKYQEAVSTSVIAEDRLYEPLQPGYGIPLEPAINLIDGLSQINAEDLRYLIAPYLHNFTLKLGRYYIDQVDYNRVSLLVSEVRDTDTVALWQPNSSYRQGVRVANQDGIEYVALNTGTSSFTSPEGLGSEILDGSIKWSAEGTVNAKSSIGWPTPWLPYHRYQKGELVSNSGEIWQCLGTGRSSGGVGPQGSGIQPDGETLWRPVSNQYPWQIGSTWYPSDVRNIRTALISAVGWSSAWGRGAGAEVVVNFQGSISAVNIVSSGTGYHSIPQYNLIGTGSGATLELQLGIVGATLQNGGLGFAVGDEILVDLGHGSPAILQVTQLNNFNQADQFQVLDPGSFSLIPSQAIQLYNQAGSTLSVKLDAGIINVSVKNSGSGYDPNSTVINFLGKEYDPWAHQFVDNHSLYVPLAYVIPGSLNTDLVDNVLDGYVLDVRFLKATVSGIRCEGISRIDSDTVSWDDDTTRFVEITPSDDVTWDQETTYWDSNQTTFDAGTKITSLAGRTIFDDGNTIFDYYATLFDQAPYSLDSSYSRSWLWWFGKPWEPAK